MKARIISDGNGPGIILQSAILKKLKIIQLA